MKVYLLKDRPDYRGIPLMAFSTKQGTGVPIHTHDFVEIVLVREGHTLHSWYDTNGEKHVRTIMKGDVYGIMPGEVHEYVNNHNFRICNIAYTAELLGDDNACLETLPFYAALFRRERLRLFPQAFKNAERIFVSITRELRYSNGHDHHFLLAKAYFIEFMNFIGSHSEAGSDLGSTASPDERIIRAVAKMEDHFTTPVTIPQIAKSAGMCYSMFSAKFKRIYGVSPQEYMILLRLEHACKLLEESDLSIAEIAFQCRFYDSNHLLKLFQRHYGLTPRQYRLKFRGKSTTS